MRIGILGNLDNPFVVDLQRAARPFFPKVETLVLRFGDMQVGIGDEGVQRAAPIFRSANGASHADPSEPLVEHDSGDIDAIIVRSMPLGSLEQVIFRMDCLQTWQSRGVRVINPPRSLETAIDKWLCLQKLNEVGVVVPPTICCQTRSSAMEAFEYFGGDVLVKPLFGGEGRGILRASEKDLAWRIFGTLQQLGQVLYVQQFIDHFGYDIRALFVGGQLYCIRRVASDGGWRTNISQGSRAEPHELTSEQQAIAEKSQAAVGGQVLGIDLLPARDGRLFVLEVNAVPGWKGLAAALNVDIAHKVIELAVRA